MSASAVASSGKLSAIPYSEPACKESVISSYNLVYKAKPESVSIQLVSKEKRIEYHP